MKNQIQEYKEAVKMANELWNKGNWQCKDIPFIPTSNMHDATLICLNRKYWTGKMPYELHKSRGNNWIVDGYQKLTVTDSNDHRDGVKELN